MRFTGGSVRFRFGHGFHLVAGFHFFDGFRAIFHYAKDGIGSLDLCVHVSRKNAHLRFNCRNTRVQGLNLCKRITQIARVIVNNLYDIGLGALGALGALGTLGALGALGTMTTVSDIGYRQSLTK